MIIKHDCITELFEEIWKNKDYSSHSIENGKLIFSNGEKSNTYNLKKF